MAGQGASLLLAYLTRPSAHVPDRQVLEDLPLREGVTGWGGEGSGDEKIEKM